MSDGRRRRILFVTSNGTGLGHLTRSMAIARRLGEEIEPFFITFSAAAPVVDGLGFPVEYISSYDRPGAGDDLSWTLRNRARLRGAVADIEPAAVVFDGTHPYERLLPSLRHADAPLIWSRRAMWRADADVSPLWRSHLFDAVLEPGDFADEADEGPTVARRERDRVRRVGPVVLLRPDELLGRERAAAELGLDPGETNVLVSLGQGAAVRETAARCLEHLAGRSGVRAVALGSSLAALGEVPEGVTSLEATYPISRFLRAFDVVVSAAGYNGFSELVRFGIPSLYVAMERQTDDQEARARWAERAGAGLACVPGDPDLERKLDELLDPARREAIAARLGELGGADGSEQAADWLSGLVGGGPAAPGSAVRAGGRSPTGASGGVSGGVALRARRAWIFASTVPATLRRLARQRRERPRMRTLIVALGVPGEELAAAVAGELAGEPAERALVVTDALDFAGLLALGAGFEQIPAPGSAQARISPLGEAEFEAARLAAILARRPRPRRRIAIGPRSERALSGLAGARRAR